MTNSSTSMFRQCECGAYRLVKMQDGEPRWAAGCAACVEIKRLRQLLGEGIHVYEGESAETLRGKLNRAEVEIERLRKKLKSHKEKAEEYRDAIAGKEAMILVLERKLGEAGVSPYREQQAYKNAIALLSPDCPGCGGRYLDDDECDRENCILNASKTPGQAG